MALVMGYIIKVQKVERPTNRSFYLNLPAVLAEALDIQKGEELQWSVEDKNTLILSRLRPKKTRALRHKP
jgi:antitoxin component of MazEF toxin-antitoxin module